MNEPVEGLVRALEAVNRRLAPKILQRFDRWLLTHRPLAWRTRIHWVVWWSLVTSPLLVAWYRYNVGALGPAPTSYELEGSAFVLLYVYVAACLIWLVLELRTPLGERLLRDHVRLFFLNACVATILLMPVPALRLITTQRVLGSIPYEELKSDLALLKSQSPEDCDKPRLLQDGRTGGDRLRDSLGHLGLTTSHSFGSCQDFEIHTADGSLMSWGVVRARLEDTCHRIEDWRATAALGRYGAPLLLPTKLAILLAFGIGILSHPRYAWWRRFGLRLSRARRVNAQVSRGPISRFNHWLLVRWPILWATGFGRTQMLVSCVVSGFAVLASGLAWTNRMAGFDNLFCLSCFFGGPIFTVAWLTARRNDVTTLPTTSPWGTLASYLAAMLPAFLCSFALGVVRATPQSLSGGSISMRDLEFCSIGLFASAWLAITFAVIRTYHGRLATALWLGSGLLWIGLVLVSSWSVVAVACVALFVLYAARVGPVTGEVKVMATLVVAAAPVALAAPILVVIERIAARYSGVASAFVLCEAGVLSSLVLLLLLLPFMRLLSRFSSLPSGS